jgi:hypothetical protein
MRRVINILQSTSMAFDEVNEDHVYTCVGMKKMIYANDLWKQIFNSY